MGTSTGHRYADSFDWFHMVSVVAWLLGIIYWEPDYDFENLIGYQGNKSWKYSNLFLNGDQTWRIENAEMWKPVYVPVS